jgi:predicted regulator of Ras-like GTPase activity (Roadblock/LC7/MglB family)
MMVSQQARDLSWLINAFANRVPGVAHAAVVSSDGLLVAVSGGLQCSNADQVAAVTAGLFSVASGAARMLDGDEVLQTVVEMDRGVFFVMSIGDGAILAVLAARSADVARWDTRWPSW